MKERCVIPIYEYECLKGNGRFEVLLPLSDYDRRYIVCRCLDNIDKIMKHDAEKVYSCFSTLSDSKETVFFENPNTKEVRLAANKYDQNPHGFEKKEAKGLTGRLSLEKRLQSQDRNIDKAKHSALQLEKSLLTKQRHENIKANFNTVHKIVDEKTGEQTGTYTYDNQTKDLMKKAMDRSSKTKPRFKERPMMFEVNHNDKSNRGTKE